MTGIYYIRVYCEYLVKDMIGNIYYESIRTIDKSLTIVYHIQIINRCRIHTAYFRYIQIVKKGESEIV
jgi:hypothetical protein